MAHVNHPTKSTPDLEQAMATSTSKAPVAAAGAAKPQVKMSSMPPGHVLREVAQQAPGERAALDIHEMEPASQSSVEHLPMPEVDSKLNAILQKYLNTEKNRTISPEKVVAFVKEQRKQLEMPEGKRDWTRARELYLDIFDMDEAAVKKMEGGRFKGGWIGSGSLYALSGQLMTFAAALPALYMATVPMDKLKADPVHYAKVNLGAQVAISLATPFVNSAIQIVMVARQELMRASGQSARSVEMKAPAYPKTDAEMKKVQAEMDKSHAKMEAHEAALRQLEPGSDEWHARLHQINVDGDEALKLMGDFAELEQKFQVRKDVIGLNYAGQIRQSITRALRTAVNLSAQVAAIATHNSHIGNYIQVGGTVAAMSIQQLWAGPADQYDKQNSTVMKTLATTRLLTPQAQEKRGEELAAADLAPDFEKLLREQMKGETTPALAQFAESLKLEQDFAQQDVADAIGMDVADFRRMETLQKKSESGKEMKPEETQQLAALRASVPLLHPSDGETYENYVAARERLTQADHEMACIKDDRWLELSEANKKFLLDAVGNEKPWLLSLRTAWVRLRVPADIISQVAQRFGSQFAMLIAGSNMQLIVSALFRYLNAVRSAEGKDPMISDNTRYVVSVLLAAVGVMGAFSAGPAVNKKISQRSRLRESIPRVGFQLRETLTALGSIGRAMFALPASIAERGSVQFHAWQGRRQAESLRQELEKVNKYLEENAPALVEEAEHLEQTEQTEPAEPQDLEELMARHELDEGNRRTT